MGREMVYGAVLSPDDDEYRFDIGYPKRFRRRIQVDTQSPHGWFDPDRATWYREEKEWDGNNMVGRASGGQVGYEALARTAGGRWVLNSDFTCEYNGSDLYAFLTDEQAQDWMMRAGVPDDQIEAMFGEVETERGPGQPRIGSVRKVTLPEDAWAELGKRAKAEGKTRAELMREAIMAYLASSELTT